MEALFDLDVLWSHCLRYTLLSLVKRKSILIYLRLVIMRLLLGDEWNGVICSSQFAARILDRNYKNLEANAD